MRTQQPKLELRRDVARPYWQLRLFVPTPDGLRRRPFKLGYRDELSRKAANKARLELLAKVNGGNLRHSGGMTFAELTERFVAMRGATMKASTLAFYKQVIDWHLLPAFGRFSLEQVTRLQVEALLASKSSLAVATRRGIRATVSVLFSAALDWQLVEHNPAARVRLGKQGTVREKATLTPAQFQRLVQGLDSKTALLVRLLAVTGMRISEAAGLRWSDIAWQANTVRVVRRYYRGTFDTPKSKASLRTHWLGTLAPELAELRPDGSKLPQAASGGDGYVFGDGETPLDERHALLTKLRPHLRSLGLPRGNGWHVFRRLHVSLLQQAGASVLETMKLVGHTSFAVSERYVVVEQAREVALVSGVCERLQLTGVLG